jgi:hypothetical protein
VTVAPALQKRERPPAPQSAVHLDNDDDARWRRALARARPPGTEGTDMNPTMYLDLARDYARGRHATAAGTRLRSWMRRTTDERSQPPDSVALLRGGRLQITG